MLKKIMIITAAVLLLFGGSVWAVDGNGPETLLTPKNPFYDAGQAIENAQYELATDLEEKIMVQDEYSKRRLAAMENAGDPEDFNELLATYAEHEQELGELLEELEGPDAEEIVGLVEESSVKKSERLDEMMVDENDLPEVARAGVDKALKNQEMAMEKLEGALKRAREAHENAGRSEGDSQTEDTGKPEDAVSPEGAGKPDDTDSAQSGPPEDIAPGSAENINPGPPANNNGAAGGGNSRDPGSGRP